MHKYRTHTCGSLTSAEVDTEVKLSGWIHTKRDHGGLIFIDLRDHYGITQIVFNEKSIQLKEIASTIKDESVITVIGKVTKRSDETINKKIPTGDIEILASAIEIESMAETLPFQVSDDLKYPESLRLPYRFIDLRREKMHKNIMLRSNIVKSIRKIMDEHGFTEFQTPILTASSPEGARDYLVPSRLHHGKFYALPQAPQQFKQLLMVAGFDKYFQIAPCFRDEDARADRSPGEFYQLDIEMSFVTQEEIFAIVEDVVTKIFSQYSNKQIDPEFCMIKYKDSMLKYGSDKPDLRIPIEISDASDIFADSEFSTFSSIVKKGGVVRAIPVKNVEKQPRSFYDKKIEFAKSVGAKGLAYIIFDETGEAKGPIAKFLDRAKIDKLKTINNLEPGDAVFFSSGKEDEASNIAGEVRTHLAKELNLIDQSIFKFCWITDFPYFEYNERTGKKKLDFAHNPFSMPQGGIEALESNNLLDIRAYQYDLVCNGIELSSGAIRNHKPEIMYKAFELAGYSRSEVDKKFGAMINALKYGAPPHGGIAPGIDRMVMLISDEENIREITAFPMTQQAEDLLMGAPATVEEEQLKILGIKIAKSALAEDEKK